MGYLYDAFERANKGQTPVQRPAGNTEMPPAPGPGAAAPVPATAASATAAMDAALPTAGDSESASAGVSMMPGAMAGAAAGPMPAAYHQTDLSLVDERLVAVTDPGSVMAEEYRSIRTSMLARWQNRRHLVHTITSGTPKEGKTITSLNLGLTFAELRNRRVVVVEADLRLPQFAALMGLAPSLGVTDLLEGKAELSQIIHKVGDSNLHILPAGRCANDQAVQLLSGTQCAHLLARLRRDFDHVIFDTPPVVDLADAGILGAMSDDVLLIVRMGHTPRQLFEQAVRVLQSYNAPVAGIVATDQHQSRGSYYSRYGYRYRYHYRNHDHQKKAA